MKRNLIGVLLAAIMVVTVLPILASPAAADNNAYTPQNLSAELIPSDQTHPYGSALLTFVIADLPRDTETRHWQVWIDRKIGAGSWSRVSAVDTHVYLDDFAKGGGSYQFEKLWDESVDWDGTSVISFRVYVVLNDETSSISQQSAYSNIASVGLKADAWAEPEVIAAIDAGIVPDSMKTKDLTQPITREEFCELAVRLYEACTGNTALPASPNPFSDTANPEILKAYALEITTGTTPTTFTPDDLVTREQCATFLFRAIKQILPADTVYDVSQVPDFPDQKYISGWAAVAVKYMANLGIIKGDTTTHNFMPKATPNAGQAAGYGQATREQAVAMSLRTYNEVK
jgi:hypothetical protein